MSLFKKKQDITFALAMQVDVMHKMGMDGASVREIVDNVEGFIKTIIDIGEYSTFTTNMGDYLEHRIKSCLLLDEYATKKMEEALK